MRSETVFKSVRNTQVSQGIATAVLVQDGRVGSLRTLPKYKTPPTCRGSRECWTCVATNHDVILVSMKNAPGRLSLGGVGHEDNGTWFRAYRRWSQALQSRDPASARNTSHELAESVVSWLEGSNPRASAVLRGYWGTYVRDLLRRYGMSSASDGLNLPDLASVVPALGWQSFEPEGPRVRSIDLQTAQERLRDRRPEEEWFSIQGQTVEDKRETLSVGVRLDALTFTLHGDAWWRGGTVAQHGEAAALAARLVSRVLELGGEGPPMPQTIPVKRIVAFVGSTDVALGWSVMPATMDPDAWRAEQWLHWWDWPFLLADWARWPLLLALGDRRVRLRVYDDGRASLSIARELWLARHK